MPVVKNVYTDDAGIALRDEWVMVTLRSRAGWSKDGSYRAVRVHSDLTDHTGLWTSPDLPPQSSYEEPDTFYEVECAGQIEYFDVPDTGGPYWLSARRRNPVPIDADWKVLPKLAELPDVNVPTAPQDWWALSWDNTNQRWAMAARPSFTQLNTAVAPKADKIYVDNADQALSNRISPLENWKPTVDTAVAGKASAASVVGVQDRATLVEGRATNLEGRVATLEGGGAGGTPAIKHSALRNLALADDGTTMADDHPQYLTVARGDARYFPRSDSDSRYAGLTHAARHATGGADPITPLSIGAMARDGGLSAAGLERADGTGQAATLGPFSLASIKNNAADPTTNYGIAAKMVNWNSNPASSFRSLRQPVVHSFDFDLGVNANSYFQKILDCWFRPRETCQLSIRYDVVGYINAGGNIAPGFMSTSVISQYLYRVPNGGTETKVYDGPGSSEIYGNVGNGNYRPATFHNWETTLNGVECEANTPYRFALWCAPHSIAATPFWIFFARVRITEVVSVFS